MKESAFSTDNTLTGTGFTTPRTYLTDTLPFTYRCSPRHAKVVSGIRYSHCSRVRECFGRVYRVANSFHEQIEKVRHETLGDCLFLFLGGLPHGAELLFIAVPPISGRVDPTLN
jgi:hypothetical protein